MPLKSMGTGCNPESKVVPLRAMTACGEKDILLYLSLISAPDGSEWLTLFLGRFIVGKRVPATN